MKAKIIWKLAKLLNNISLFTFIFPDRIILKNHHMENKIISQEKDLTISVIYTGAIGKFQKFTLQLIDRNFNIISFFKAATIKDGIVRIQNEEKALKMLESKFFEKIVTPKLIKTLNTKEYYGILQKNIIYKNEMTLEFTDLDISVINEMYLKSDVYELTFKKYYDGLVENIDISELAIQKSFLEKINAVKIIFMMSHGDYIPWNRFLDSKVVKIIDWEMFNYRPVFYDI
jgi:hypothetical protein